MSDVRLGVKSKLYLNTGSYGTPAWEEANLISDLQVNASWDEGESSARISLVKTAEPTMLALDIAGKVRVDYAKDHFRLMHEAFIAADSLDVMVLDGAHTQNGSIGYRFDAKIFQWSEDQSLGAVLFKDFTMKPCATDTPAKAVAVAAGVPVFSEIGDTEAVSFDLDDA